MTFRFSIRMSSSISDPVLGQPSCILLKSRLSVVGYRSASAMPLPKRARAPAYPSSRQDPFQLSHPQWAQSAVELQVSLRDSMHAVLCRAYLAIV